MQWHSDPATPWVAIYRILVLILLAVGAYLHLDSKTVLLENTAKIDAVVGTPTPAGP